VAVDVGRAQIHAKLLADERVTSWESTNVSAVTPDRLGAVPGYEHGAEIVVAELSFVSLAATVPALVAVSAPGADLVVMVKPQFEASREDVPAGGVVMDESVQRRAVDAVADALVEAGCELRGTCESPITGTEGNKEFFLWAVRGSSTHRQR
jgi:23S rRNA (cytidine1920-2'-O)/16S rRNA (cytidine1409-2'-O)-methyltransferase